MNTLILYSIALRFAQGIFSYLNIAIQSNALSERDFIEFSVVMNAILLSTFLDLGIGIRFVQNHLHKRGNTENEDSHLLNYLRRNIFRFLAVSIFQSAIISGYATIYYLRSREAVDVISLLTIFISCLTFSLAGLVARILIARGLIAESIRYQLYGLVTQSLISLIGLYLNFDVLYFITSLAVPNFVTAYFSVRLIVKSTQHQKLSFTKTSDPLSSGSVEIQTLQILQFLFGILPFIILANNYSSTFFSENIIEWRIFSSVSAAMSSLNLIQWRNLATRNPYIERTFTEDSSLRFKVSLGLVLSICVAVATYLSWDVLSGNNSGVNISNLLLWSLYVPAQVIQWHYSYQYLSSSHYNILIMGTLLQIVSTLGSLIFFATSMSYRLPVAVLLGLFLSIVLFYKARKRYIGEM